MNGEVSGSLRHIPQSVLSEVVKSAPLGAAKLSLSVDHNMFPVLSQVNSNCCSPGYIYIQ